MPNIYLVGDSLTHDYNYKSYPQCGIGEIIRRYAKDDIKVLNYSHYGLSTKSFLNQNRFEPIKRALMENDLLFIILGTNDEVFDNPIKYTDKDSDYLENIDIFCTEAINKGAIPIVVSSPCKRVFINNIIQNVHHGYPEALIKHAIENNYLYVDLHSLSLDLYQKLGPAETKKFHLIYGKNEFDRYPDGVNDNTHYNYLGAKTIAELLLEDLKRKFKNYDLYFEY
ncbi:MAG: hypothetical protein K6G28_00925 [Acholeplasmatales bacterium]|nr:hypothetical protein [Acholeplasmatales bacterium]